MGKTDRSVVRNGAYKKSEFSIRERHNERLNESYYNSDIQQDRQHLNVYFKQNENNYAEIFDAMLAAETISTRGQKADAKVFDELVFDVNTDYFERNGGYEYAKSFFEETYRCAVDEVGGEEYILSAVMHADERNKALSEQYGRDIYHYHLHVVYIPVVDKEILWTKRCKDPELVGTVKETIKQVSHSKKWPRFKDDNGHWINSYSLLQDRFHEHMKNAGYIGFERGERGSTAEHFATEEYKTQQEKKRAAEYIAIAEEKQETAAALDVVIEDKTQTADELDKSMAKKQKQLDALDKKIKVSQEAEATVDEIDGMGKKTMFGKIELTQENWKTVSGIAKESVKTRGIIATLKAKITELMNKITGLEKRLKKYEGLGVTDTMRYYEARQRAPRRMAEIIADIMRKPPEQERQRPERTVTKKKDLEI